MDIHKKLNLSKIKCEYCGSIFKSTKKLKKYCSPSCHSKTYLSKIKVKSGITNTATGAIGELAAAQDLLLKHYHVFRNISPSGPIDLVAYKNNKIIKIEVKTGRINTKGLLYYRKPANNDWDILIVYIIDEEKFAYFDSKFNKVILK